MVRSSKANENMIPKLHIWTYISVLLYVHYCKVIRLIFILPTCSVLESFKMKRRTTNCYVIFKLRFLVFVVWIYSEPFVLACLINLMSRDYNIQELLNFWRIFLNTCYRKLMEKVVDSHENAKEAKRKIQAYKSKIVQAMNEETRDLMRRALEEVTNYF